MSFTLPQALAIAALPRSYRDMLRQIPAERIAKLTTNEIRLVNTFDPLRIWAWFGYGHMTETKLTLDQVSALGDLNDKHLEMLEQVPNERIAILTPDEIRMISKIDPLRIWVWFGRNPTTETAMLEMIANTINDAISGTFNGFIPCAGTIGRIIGDKIPREEICEAIKPTTIEGQSFRFLIMQNKKNTLFKVISGETVAKVYNEIQKYDRMRDAFTRMIVDCHILFKSNHEETDAYGSHIVDIDDASVHADIVNDFKDMCYYHF